MIQAILFDFNGVIINDEGLQLEAYQDALREETIALTEEDYYSALGMDDKTFVQTCLARAGKPLTDELIAKIIEHKARLHRKMIEDDVPLFPGVETFLKHVARFYMLGISSMERRAEIDYVLKRSHLDGAFSVIVSAEEARACKPDPSCYLRALELLNEKRAADGLKQLPARDCLAIEDAPPGIEAARSAGMRSLAVTNTVSEESLRAARADVVTNSLADWNADAVHHVFDTDYGATNE